MKSNKCFRCNLLQVFVSLILLSTILCANVTETSRNYRAIDGSGWSFSQSAPSPQSVLPSNQAQNSPPYHEKYETQSSWPKQGALMGNPLYGVFPVIFLIGLAALILIPLLFFVFSPYGLTMGQGSYAHKRSDEWNMKSFKKNIVDLAANVGDAIDKYSGIASLAMSVASLSDKKKI